MSRDPYNEDEEDIYASELLPFVVTCAVVKVLLLLIHLVFLD